MRTLLSRILLVVLALLTARMSHAQEREWLVGPGYAGQVRVGMTVDALYDAYGRENVRLVDLFGEGMFQPAVQIYAPFDQASPLLVAPIAHICGYRVTSIEVLSPRFHTAAGVRVGSTIADVARAYPGARRNREAHPLIIVPDMRLTFMASDASLQDTLPIVKIWTHGAIPDSIRAQCR